MKLSLQRTLCLIGTALLLGLTYSPSAFARVDVTGELRLIMPAI